MKYHSHKKRKVHLEAASSDSLAYGYFTAEWCGLRNDHTLRLRLA